MKLQNSKTSLFVALTSIIGPTGAASGDLLIYEPFDYESTAEINANGFFGDGNQEGGFGVGIWGQISNGAVGTAAAPPTNEGDVADEGVTFTDAEGNELPVAGNAYERRGRVGQVACFSSIDAAATAGLTTDNSTMWMTFLFQDFGFSGPDFGIGLHSEKMIGNDNQDLEAPGFGVGFGIVSTGGQARNIGTAVYNNAVNFTRQFEETPTFNGPAASETFFLAMKVNWKPEGTPDEIFVFIIDDLTTEPEEADAVASDTFDWDLATQQSLDVFNFSDTQVGYVDEIRVGNAYGDVVGGTIPSSSPLQITEITYTPGHPSVSLTWNSKDGISYAVRYSRDMVNWDFDLDDAVLGTADSTTQTFNLSEFGIANEKKLYFRVEKQ
ncbi:MAG TPA: hypothetical protein DIS80_00940 [Verrucomicrobiales bacterium]|nr:hypothetical protein [Verrucomicrobiales bacterium]